MEADIITEEFAKSMQMHGVKHNKLVGYGDSSIMKKLLLKKPYGPDFIITKIECKNLLLRNFCNKIKALEKKTNIHKGFVPVDLRKKVASSVLRLRKAVVGAINYRKLQDGTNYGNKINNHKMDIKNSANHVFGDHKICASYYCRSEKYIDDINVVPDLQFCGIWADIQQNLLILLSNAESLILDVTNNIEEQFNNVIAKFIGGKRVNYIARGSSQARCFGAKGNSVLKKILKGLEEENLHYAKKYQTKEKKLLDLTRIMLNNTIDEIERNTVGQSGNKLWLVERRKRLTASNFCKICKLPKTTSVAGLLKSLLYSQFEGTLATNYGKEKENEAIQQFTEETGLMVSKCGLFIDKHKTFLAASPDGLVGEDSIVEIKCPYKIVDLSPIEGIEQKAIDFCTFKDNTLKLKRNHNYYYQIQGQLHITGRNISFFILWSPRSLLYERFKRDGAFWQKMEPILELFYLDCLLPDIIDGRIPRNLAVRERKVLAMD
ncbi:hypothetical protein ACJJTC_016093 [Scirpophaga incertulas]